MLAFLIYLITLGRVFTISPGSVGVVNQFGNVKESVGPGMHAMGFGSGFTELTTRTQSTHTDLLAGSKDNLSITYKVTTNWHLDPNGVMDFYKQYGDDDKERIDAQIINTNIQEKVKTAATGFMADEQLGKQQETRKATLEMMRNDLQKYHIIVDDVVFDDIDFGASYNASFERKGVAKQDAEAASYLKQKSQNEADASVIAASGAAKVKVLGAEAEAKAQELVRQSLTPEILQQQAISKWNGAYPQYMLGGSSVPLIQVGK